MYDSLSIAEKTNLLREYKKAYPDKNFKSIVKHFNEGMKQYGDGGKVISSQDSLRHQAGKTMDYEFKKGSAEGTGLSNYGNPALGNNPSREQAVEWYMQNIAPKLKPYPSAMEKGEAGDFLYNSGKDVRPFAYQEYLRKTDPQNKTNWKDDKGNWKDRKSVDGTTLDSLYRNSMSKLSENERRIYINKGRDWYYQNINNPSPGVPSPAYEKTWKPRIWEAVNQYGDGGELTSDKPVTNNIVKDPPKQNVYQAKDQKDYEYRNQMYNDSLAAYNFGENLTKNFANEIKTIKSKNIPIKYKKSNKTPYPGTNIFPYVGGTATWESEDQSRESHNSLDSFFKNFGLGTIKENDILLEESKFARWKKPTQQILPPKQDTVKTNFEKRIQNPTESIKNKDGSISTHKMMSFEADGKYYAAPTIIKRNGKLEELSQKDAIDYAFKNNEFKEFKTDKEAKEYANNGYKKGTPLEDKIAPQQDTLPKWNKGYYGQQPYGYITKNGKVIRGATREEWNKNKTN